jgi:hypothetical protein
LSAAAGNLADERVNSLREQRWEYQPAVIETVTDAADNVAGSQKLAGGYEAVSAGPSEIAPLQGLLPAGTVELPARTVELPARAVEPDMAATAGPSFDARISSRLFLAVGAMLGLTAVALLYFFVSFNRRLQSIQSSTIRIELANVEQAIAPLLAMTAAARQTAAGEGRAVLSARTGRASALPLEAALPPEAALREPLLSENPERRIRPRRTQVVDANTMSLPVDLGLPGFADARKAAEEQQQQREQEIFQAIFKQNLSMAEGLDRLRVR